jgi:hypothetical protein
VRRTPSPRKNLASANVGKCHEDVPENFSSAEGKACLIIFDDLLNDVYSKEVCHLFTKGNHHRNISIVLIRKNASPGAVLQGHLSKCKTLGAPKKVRDKNQFTHLARQVYTEDSGRLYEACLDATAKPHGYLVLDVSQDTDDLLRFRNNIFPEEVPPVISAPVSDETDKVQLSRSTNASNSRT